MPSRPTSTLPGPVVGGVLGTFHVGLLAVLVLVATAFGRFHRLAEFDLLFLVCLLGAFGVVAGLVGLPLRHIRCGFNLVAWAALALVLAQVIPLPLGSPPPADAGPTAGVLTDALQERAAPRPQGVPTFRWSLRPTASTGVFFLAASAAGLYWLVSSVPQGRKALRRVTWAAALGLALVAYWTVMAGTGSPRDDPGVARPAGPLLILGGDSTVPALLAALPLVLAGVLRTLSAAARVPRRLRQAGRGWLERSRFAWAGLGLALAALIAAALGLSNVPAEDLAVAATLAAGGAMTLTVLAGQGGVQKRRRARWAIFLGLWVAAAVWAGAAAGRPHQPAASADAALRTHVAAQPPPRAALGDGAGAVSPRATYGLAGWPGRPGNDVDTSGYLVLRAEMGWVGLGVGALVLASLGFFLIRAWRRSGGPWPRAVLAAALGGLAANLWYFRHDAAALLAVNLLGLAIVFGLAAAWAAHAVAWRPARQKELGASHWPLVAAAVGLLGALGMAESEMLDAGAHDLDVGDKVLHFGSFAVVSMLLCYALGPRPTTHYLRARILMAVVLTAGLGLAMEFGQYYLTASRAFEAADILANALGASLMGLLWWVVRRGQLEFQ